MKTNHSIFQGNFHLLRWPTFCLWSMFLPRMLLPFEIDQIQPIVHASLLSLYYGLLLSFFQCKAKTLTQWPISGTLSRPGTWPSCDTQFFCNIFTKDINKLTSFLSLCLLLNSFCARHIKPKLHEVLRLGMWFQLGKYEFESPSKPESMGSSPIWGKIGFKSHLMCDISVFDHTDLPSKTILLGWISQNSPQTLICTLSNSPAIDFYPNPWIYILFCSCCIWNWAQFYIEVSFPLLK